MGSSISGSAPPGHALGHAAPGMAEKDTPLPP
jgi:hypothetical protein